MYEAYVRVFKRCGLKAIPVEADTGVMGGKFSHEFMVPAETGESEVAYCESGDYAANVEKAISQIPSRNVPTHAESAELEKFPPEERAACVAVWRDLEAVLLEIETRPPG